MRTKSPNEPMRENEGVDSGRRTLFALAAVSPLLLFGLSSRPASAQATACFDLAKLPMSDRSIRTSLGYKMQATDPNKKCGSCAFFKEPKGECGKCEIFNMGPTTANGSCNSWAKKG